MPVSIAATRASSRRRTTATIATIAIIGTIVITGIFVTAGNDRGSGRTVSVAMHPSRFRGPSRATGSFLEHPRVRRGLLARPHAPAMHHRHKHQEMRLIVDARRRTITRPHSNTTTLPHSFIAVPEPAREASQGRATL